MRRAEEKKAKTSFCLVECRARGNRIRSLRLREIVDTISPCFGTKQDRTWQFPGVTLAQPISYQSNPISTTMHQLWRYWHFYLLLSRTLKDLPFSLIEFVQMIFFRIFETLVWKPMLKMWGSYFQGHQILDKEIVKSCGNFLLFFNSAITIVIFFYFCGVWFQICIICIIYNAGQHELC